MTLTVNSLCYERHYIPLFADVNFQLAPGQIIQIEGSNGTGKTTLLRLLAGFCEPTSGSIHWCNQSIQAYRDLFQEEMIYLGHQNGLRHQLTVLENVQLMCALLKIPYTIELIRPFLNSLGLANAISQTVKTLSFGQKRRLSYMRLKLSNKKLWLLDEPTTGIDQTGQGLFVQLVESHVRQGGMAIISTHQSLPFSLPVIRLRMG